MNLWNEEYLNKREECFVLLYRWSKVVIKCSILCIHTLVDNVKEQWGWHGRDRLMCDPLSIMTASAAIIMLHSEDGDVQANVRWQWKANLKVKDKNYRNSYDWIRFVLCHLLAVPLRNATNCLVISPLLIRLIKSCLLLSDNRTTISHWNNYEASI